MREGGPTEPNQAGESVGHPVRAFVSYAHDDAAHVDRVREFWRFLCSHGIDAHVDLPAGERRQDWPEWTAREVHEAEWVLVIASPEYKRRAEGNAGPAEGRGVQWEARLIRDRLYANQNAGLQAVLPVVLPGCSPADIPLWLAPSSATYYVVSEYTVAGAEKLLRLLTGQAYEAKAALGMVPVLLPRDAPDAVSPAPVSLGDPSAAPAQPDAAGPGGNEAMLRGLADVSSSLAAIKPLPSWTPRRWMVESTPLRMRLVALEGHFNRLLNERDSSAATMRQAIRLNSKITEIKQLAKNIRTSLNYLKDDSSPSETHDRELNVFIKNSTDLQRAVLQIQSILSAADPVNRPVISVSAEQGSAELEPAGMEPGSQEQPRYVLSFPETDEIGDEWIGKLRPLIDTVLITANETELLAVLNKLQPLPRRRKVLLVYGGQETYYVGKFGAYPSVVTKCRMGASIDGAAILATDLAQRLWLPRYYSPGLLHGVLLPSAGYGARAVALSRAW